MDGVTYHAHLEWLIRQEVGARAERYGFVDARLHVTAPFSGDAYEQQRYQQGYEDGKIMLQAQEGAQPL